MDNDKRKPNEIFGHEQVRLYLDRLEHPFKSEIIEVRRIVLHADEHLTEHIKWNAPSFCYDNKDRITFNLHGKNGFRLIFHCGSKSTEQADKGPLFEDHTKMLEWITGDRAVVKFTSKEDVTLKEEKLKEVVIKWIEETKKIN
ncbi:DUF1801 domain-containing protein [Paenibacillus sp. J5C_2022]|uniref:DUF1801 domain-containing protein n=1 Tax=Paenibacillus sp. J5C2022 TaxID=2977129 RepID=UPI0021D0A182|nr:DUF1801 domain-containing protein [Paenibacillus sp. J5C2022]MCU6713058.1 DUF1801 domain-containing protein [Paenibacillus sp. J5C2022]